MDLDLISVVKVVMNVRLIFGFYYSMKSIEVSRPLQWLAKFHCVLMTTAIVWGAVFIFQSRPPLAALAFINIAIEVGIYYITPMIYRPDFIEYARQVVFRNQRSILNSNRSLLMMMTFTLTVPFISALTAGAHLLLTCIQIPIACTYSVDALGKQIILAFLLLSMKISQIPKHLLLGLLYCDAQLMHQFLKNHAFCNFASPHNMCQEYLEMYDKMLKDFKKFKNYLKVMIIFSLLSLSTVIVYVTLHVSSLVLGGYSTFGSVQLIVVIINESLNVIPAFVLLEMIANTGDNIRAEILKQIFSIQDDLSRQEMNGVLQYVRSRPLRLSCLWGSTPLAAILAVKLFSLTVTYLIAILQINHI